MKVLMFGWEFPPFNKGGLGTACFGLTRGLRNNNIDVTFVLPKAPKGAKSDHVELLVADSFYLDESCVKFLEIESLLVPYITSAEYASKLSEYKQFIRKDEDYDGSDDLYGKDLYSEVYRYASKAKLLSALEDHDIIHAHDWMTFPAAVEAKKVSGKPMVIHVHATEFDRTGGNGCNQKVYDIERMGMHAADKIMAVSNLTKERIVGSYGIEPSKVEVVHNAVDFNTNKFDKKKLKIASDEKVILFLGRITMQKGPEYFLRAAKKVIDLIPDKKVKFVFAGTGDMEGAMVDLAADLGIGDKVLFAGWVTGPDIDRLYSMADLYVMPSVSEPFGITPLEAMRNNTPVLISKTSGVSEVVKHAMKIDFWDVDEMAEKMIAIVNYQPLQDTLAENGFTEVHTFNWDKPAEKCVSVYNSVLNSYKDGNMKSAHNNLSGWTSM
ncbi:MAG: glycosyltransferase family 4 protein [Nanoarchaeota archaeon]